MKRIAISKLILRNGDVLKNQVVEIDETTNEVVNYYSLTEELPSTEWHDMTYKI